MRLIRRVASSEWPPSAKKLSSIPTRSSPSTSANSAHRISSCGVRAHTPHRSHRLLRRRQRTTVELAVGRERKTIQHHKRRRHHVLGKAPRKMRTQHTPHPEPQLPPRPHSQPAACLRARPRAQSPPPAQHPHAATSAASISPRLDAEPTHLHLRIRTPQELQHPVAAPARKVAGAVHPAPRSTKRVRNKPLRRQTRTAHIPRARPDPAM